MSAGDDESQKNGSRLTGKISKTGQAEKISIRSMCV